MLSKIDLHKILKLLRTEVTPTMGCTEPLTVALAAAKATELLQTLPDKVVARLSSMIVKNSMGVGIPGSNGWVGLPSAVALGCFAGRTDNGLDAVPEITDEVLSQAQDWVADRHCIIKQAIGVFEHFYVEIEATAGDLTAKVIIAKEPDNYVYLKVGDQTLLDERSTLVQEHQRNHDTWLSIQMIHDFVRECPLEDLHFLVDGARRNKDVAQMAFEGDYGLNLGKMLKGSFEERMVGQNAMPRVVCYTCAACDVRMSGKRVPVVSNCGSGTQGIAATLPVLIFAEESMCTESKLARALALSHLVVIYIKQMLGRMSSHCMCVLAATGSACGITYLMGGTFEQVCAAVKNEIAGLTGMVCDGAKPSCTLKLSTAASSAFQSAMMAMEGICVSNTDGIIEESVDRSIENLANIGLDAVLEIDKVLLKIIDEKE